MRAWFVREYAASALFSALALAGWLTVWLRARAPAGFGVALAALLLAELLWFAHDVNPQNDPALDFPRLPALEAAAAAPPGRALGVYCLPANILESHGLWDVRGYDGVDPGNLVDLLELVADPEAASLVYSYAKLQWFTPKLAPDGSSGYRIPPALDMLNVRYLIFRGSPPPEAKPLVASDGYWVVENRRALPRAWVPRRAVPLPSDPETLRLLSSDAFDPREVAYVDGPVAAQGPSVGSAAIQAETPGEVRIAASMQTPGLVVLADRWDAGWRATLNGRPAPILRANHLLRAVEVPSGPSEIVFRYQPAGFGWGWKLSAAGAAGWLAWCAAVSAARRARVAAR